MGFRIEKDSMGSFEVPEDALYGAQTARAVANFPISGQTIGRDMIKALAWTKLSAAQVNRELGKLAVELADAIAQAAGEVVDGVHDAHFPVDVFQTGSGTSSNMNANEVIANRANQLLGGELGSKHPVHPNDHVNLGQSSNDVFPTAIHVAALTRIEGALLPSLHALHDSLVAKAKAFDDVIKTGRTHLQDATPITLGQVFSGYASQIEHGISHLQDACGHLAELAIGGTAVGTGINTHPEFGHRMAERLSQLSGVAFVEAPNHFEAQAAQDAAVAVSGALKTLAVSVMKIANDIRHLGSGPRFGLGELIVPAIQPGSSIMPGKVNPVLCEALIMVAAQVIGNDSAITLGGAFGNFELNVMLPLIARNLLSSVDLLANGVNAFRTGLLVLLEADREAIAAKNERSLMLATALAPLLGYDKAAQVAKQAHAEGKTVRQVALELELMSAEELDRVLDPLRLIRPQ